MGSLGKDDFRKLETLWLDGNELTDASCATLLAFINARLPRINHVSVTGNPASEEAKAAVHQAAPFNHMMGKLALGESV